MSRSKRKKIRRSGFEDDIEKDLRERGVPYRYEPWQLEYYKPVVSAVVWDTELNHAVRGPRYKPYAVRSYMPDFVITKPMGQSPLVIEAKGRLTPATRTKMLLVNEQHPDLDIRFMFYRKEKIKLKKTPYNTDWAELHGFDYTVGTKVPEEWL